MTILSNFVIGTIHQYIDKTEQRKARLLAFLLAGLGLFTLVGLVAGLVRGISWIATVSLLFLLLAMLVSAVLLRARYLAAASWLFLVSWTLLVTVSLLSPGMSPIFPFILAYLYSPAVVASSMLLAPGSSFLWATLVIICVSALFMLSGGMSAADIPETSRNEVFLLTIPLSINYVLALISWLFGRDVQRAMRQAEDNAAALAQQLSADQALIGDVGRAATQLRAMSEQLAATLEELNAGAEQIALTTTDLAQGASSQAQQGEQSAQAMYRLDNATHQIAGSARMVGDATAQAQELVQGTQPVITSLSEKLRMIEDVVTMVDKIADQTNLLALNASIEAARAGEHGAGFSVVAEEVRRLAEHSAASVGEISVLSKDIGTRLEMVVERIQQMTQETSYITESASQVAAMTREQQTASESMLDAANGMAIIAEKNAVASEQIAASVEEQVASIEQISQSVQMMAELSSRLQDTLSAFSTSANTVCSRFATCPICRVFTTDPVLSRRNYITRFCSGDFVNCERRKLAEAGQPVPNTLLPDGQIRDIESGATAQLLAEG